jgi:hypothetical protein
VSCQINNANGERVMNMIMRQLAAYPRQNGVAAALRELGRLERTLLTLDWISEPQLRRETGHELNKGEARNSLARAVFIHRLGESATEPMRTSSTALRDSTCSSPPLSCGTRVTLSVPWPTCARPRTYPTICSPISRHSVGST